MTAYLGRLIAIATFLAVLRATPSAADVRHVVLLQSLERGNLTLDYFTASFLVALDKGASDPVRVTQFVVQLSGVDETPEQAMLDYLRAAFVNRPAPDLVITTGGPAAAFARKYRAQIFPDTPLLFAAVDQRFLDGAPLAANETAVAVINDMAAIVDDMLQVFPQTANVLVLSGSGALGRFWHAELDRDFRRFRNRIKFSFSDEASLPEILGRVAALPPNSAIFYVTFGSDTAGAYSDERALAELHAAANAPLFGTQGALMGHGIVGGRLMPTDELGQIAADVALRLLNGESPASIHTAPQRPGAPVFDWRELQRWGVGDSRLPAGSVLQFVEPGAWERFKGIIISGVLVVIAEALLIAALLIHRGKRQLAERRLLQNVADLDTARAALSNLSRRLMEAQEEERTRVARELHDDVIQRMTFVAMDLGRLRETLPATEPGAQDQAQGLYDAVIELAHDVKGISRQMHSSRIDLLGLPVAAENLCKEMSSHQGLQIEYVHENVPARLPDAVGISVFRVLQEALSNAAKHAGARHCNVRLLGSRDALTLEVIDDGRGFDAIATKRAHGLGLISMQERLKLVNGELAIESKIGAGTSVRGRVPLRMQPDLTPSGL
jgi:signal transduction histidine kinase